MFRFDFDKTVQAVAQMLRNEPSHRLNYMRLIKLIYMADRKSLAETGHPITGDRAAAMERGPVLSNLLDLVKGKHRRNPEWSRFFRRDRYELVMIDDPGNDRLSRYEAEKLAEVTEENQDLDEWDVADKTHHFDEYKKNQPPKGSRRWISAADIFEAVGFDQAEIEQVRKEARAEAAFAQLAAQTRGSSSPSDPPATAS